MNMIPTFDIKKLKKALPPKIKKVSNLTDKLHKLHGGLRQQRKFCYQIASVWAFDVFVDPIPQSSLLFIYS